ncbi:MmcQ/YjbR family DNA-binding protein [uncultured Veillonella sp.]|uniref:MmcQ/YjbR family DNA-binding protein n=1 Tax=uncultured Veillonella sp. TaxID=159268 RepID=UPI0025DA9E9C|nr:MmcQ/YjbR family DNA-binding protein [uncultured Veillonella sp.]MDY3973253.1 MmcQ/YjbR family DNA-binding protein [Veillonella caviae]
MFFNEQLANYELNEKKAIALGCEVQTSGAFAYSQLIASGAFRAIVEFTYATMEVQLIDTSTEEAYTLLDIPSSDGPFVTAVRHEVEVLVQHILDQCFDFKNTKKYILDYMVAQYGTEPEAPWQKYPQYLTFKTEKSKKWYAVYMNIPFASLGLEGRGEANIINVKVSPEDVEAYVDGKNFFPAYHMNKKHWLTILLHKESLLDIVKALIDKSYSLVEDS